MPDQTSTAENAREIANVAEGIVVSLPQCMTSLLLCVALGDSHDATGQNRPKWSEREMACVSRASQYIRTDFKARFEKAAGELSAAMKTAHTQLDDVLRDALERVQSISRAADQDAIVDCAQFTQEAVAPAVTGFLDALFTQVVAHEKAAAKLAKDVDASALTQIDVLSRQINFIAVNASVEAARVGDKGRGFAIIATEIKALSEQSREAVDRIRMALS